MSLTFHDTHRELVFFNVLGGISVPGLPLGWEAWRPKFQQYSRVLFAMQVVSAIGMYLGLASFQNMTTLLCTFIIAPTMMFGPFCVGVFATYRTRFESLIARFDRLAEVYAEDETTCKRFQVRLQANYRIAKRAIQLLPAVINLTLCEYHLSSLVRSFGWFGLDGEKHLPYDFWLPFVEVFSTPWFELVVLFVFVAAIVAVLQMFCTELFFVALMIQEYTHLQVSHEALQDIFDSARYLPYQAAADGGRNDSYSPGETTNSCIRMDCELMLQLDEWIAIHQQIMGLGEEICEFYKPIFTANLGRMLAVVTLILYLVTQLGWRSSIAMIGSLYLISVLSIFLSLCVVGDIMATESCRIAELAAKCPAYPCSNRDKNSLVLVTLRAQKTLQVRSYFHWAKLSKVSFVDVIRMVISYYLALVSIRDAKNK